MATLYDPFVCAIIPLPVVPVLGPLLRLRLRPLETFLEAAQLSDIVFLGTIKKKPYYIISNPDLTQQLLRSNECEVSRGGVVREIFGRSMFILEGEEWARRRKRLSHSYRAASNSTYLQIISDVIDSATSRWDGYASSGRAFDLTTEFMEIARSFVVQAMFGVKMDADAERLKILFQEGMRFRHRHRWRFLDLPRWLPTPGNRRFHHAKHELDELVTKILADAQAAQAPHPNFLTELISAYEQEEGALKSKSDIRDEIVMMFAVGHLTTGAAMTWSVLETIRHPLELQRLRDEHERHLSTGPLLSENLRRMTASLRILKEAWRMYPPVWMISRRVKQETILNGAALPAGAVLLFSAWAVHRDPRWWHSPKKFWPDRFLPENENPSSSSAYFPFGAGARSCPGQELSTLESLAAISILLSRFDLTLENDKENHPIPLSILSPPDHLMVTARPRNLHKLES